MWLPWKLVSLFVAALSSGCVSAATTDGPAPEVKVFTFNIMWEENGVRAGNKALPVWADRKAMVANLIQREGADVVGFQEASPEQQAGLRNLLPEYTLVWHAATNNTNPILFKTARFKRVDSGAFNLNHIPEVEGTNIGIRSSTWAHLEERESGKRFHVYSLHLDHRSEGATRQISAVRLVERIARHGGPVFVTGDYNCSETSPTMTFFHGQRALKNDAGESVSNTRPLLTAYKTFHPEDRRRVIDHALAGPGIRVIDAGRVASRQASDHDMFWVRGVLE